MSPRCKGVLAIVASAFGFALMALFVRLCDDCGPAVNSFQKSFFRNLVALLVAAVAWVRTRDRGDGAFLPSRSAWLPLVLRSTLGSVGIFANFHALSHIPIAEGQTLNKTAPFFTVLFAWLFLGERMNRRQALAVVLAFCGVLLIAKPGFAGAAAMPLATGFLGGVCAGGAYACVRALRRHVVSPSFIVLFFSAFSCAASVPFMLADFDPMTGAQVLVLLGAGVGAAIGQFGITLAYGYAAPREIAVFDYTNILFTAALGWLFFGQFPDFLSVVGFAVILSAAVFLARADGAAARLAQKSCQKPPRGSPKRL
ncbi:MAG: DMT family transporter [Kiritimatiellia bacterium]